MTCVSISPRSDASTLPFTRSDRRLPLPHTTHGGVRPFPKTQLAYAAMLQEQPARGLVHALARVNRGPEIDEPCAPTRTCGRHDDATVPRIAAPARAGAAPILGGALRDAARREERQRQCRDAVITKPTRNVA